MYQEIKKSRHQKVYEHEYFGQKKTWCSWFLSKIHSRFS